MLQQGARDVGILWGGPVVAFRLPQEAAAVRRDLQDAARLPGRGGVPRLRRRRAACVVAGLSRLAFAPVRPGRVVPAVGAPPSAVLVAVVVRRAVGLRPTVVARARRSGIVRRRLRIPLPVLRVLVGGLPPRCAAGMVIPLLPGSGRDAMRMWVPALRGPTVTVVASVSQG